MERGSDIMQEFLCLAQQEDFYKFVQEKDLSLMYNTFISTAKVLIAKASALMSLESQNIEEMNKILKERQSFLNFMDELNALSVSY